MINDDTLKKIVTIAEELREEDGFLDIMMVTIIVGLSTENESVRDRILSGEISPLDIMGAVNTALSIRNN